ncbi:MAG: peptidyl-prolyl cis-trans isomerase [Phycisphaerae bacterium]|nr:peptidyl-prolyl cis-trans isomerase [Phycisphaerae bacterium]
MTQDQTPQLHLPQRQAPKPGGSAAGKIACVLLIVVIALQAYALVHSPVAKVEPVAAESPPTSAGNAKAIAMKLEDRNLPVAAADAWREYLEDSVLEPLDRAKILYRIGKLEFQSEQYQQAVADLYLAERLVGDRDDQLSRQITMQVRECLQKMGRYAELAREMAAHAGIQSEEEATLASRQTVAQVGDHKITVPEFDRMLQAKIEMSIRAQPNLSSTQADEVRKQAIKQMANPQAKVQFLREIMVGRVLAMEAKACNLDQSTNYRQRLTDLSDDLLASMLLTEEIEKRATVTPGDVERHYAANKDKYADPAKLKLAHIALGSEEEAREVLARVQAGEDFAELAEEFSLDKHTKKNGGRISKAVPKGAAFIPGIGRQAELQSAIWAVSPGGVLGEVYKAGLGWQVVKVLERTEAVQKPFEEVKGRVERDTQKTRRREVTRKYIDQLFVEHQVKLYPEAFLPATGEGAKGKEDEEAAD